MRELCMLLYNELYNVVYNYTVRYIIETNADSGYYLFEVIIIEMYSDSELYNNVYTLLYNDIYHLLHTKTI